eukprot:5438914-Amphidinium_carterae.1
MKAVEQAMNAVVQVNVRLPQATANCNETAKSKLAQSQQHSTVGAVLMKQVPVYLPSFAGMILEAVTKG